MNCNASDVTQPRSVGMSGYEDSDQPAAAYSAAVAGWLHQVYHAQMMHYGNIPHHTNSGSQHITHCLVRFPQFSRISSLEREVAITTAATRGVEAHNKGSRHRQETSTASLGRHNQGSSRNIGCWWCGRLLGISCAHTHTVA